VGLVAAGAGIGNHVSLLMFLCTRRRGRLQAGTFDLKVAATLADCEIRNGEKSDAPNKAELPQISLG
jgi:hypothetical protein